MMNITIQTIRGTFIVPPEKQDLLTQWLENNAIKVQQKLGEIKEDYTARQLLGESYDR